MLKTLADAIPVPSTSPSRDMVVWAKCMIEHGACLGRRNHALLLTSKRVRHYVGVLHMVQLFTADQVLLQNKISMIRM